MNVQTLFSSLLSCMQGADLAKQPPEEVYRALTKHELWDLPWGLLPPPTAQHPQGFLLLAPSSL